MAKHTESVILVFAKAPVAGRVKTRLTPHLSAEQAAILHQHLVHRCLKTCVTARLCDVQLWCSPSIDHPFFDDCRERYRIVLKNQSGHDLGERMLVALRVMLQKYKRAVIVGTDVPELDSDLLDDAIEKLASTDIVLAPAQDGGYVLLGASSYHDDLLAEVPWGTPGVLERTLHNVDQLGFEHKLLAECWDVDRPEDLERYLALNPDLARVFQRKGAKAQSIPS